jgi:hypothetical protein
LFRNVLRDVLLSNGVVPVGVILCYTHDVV